MEVAACAERAQTIGVAESSNPYIRQPRHASVCLALVLYAGVARAQAVLPYAERTRALSGVSTTTTGDIRTVGMGGASSGLADTFIAAIGNPAGLAMTNGVGDIHYTSNSFQDGHVQGFHDPQQIQSLGLSLGLYPWAISAGYLSPYSESGTFQLPLGLPQRPQVVALRSFTREWVVSAARVFLHNRLSIGASVGLGQAERSISVAPSVGDDASFASYAAVASAGAMVKLPKRVLLGASFSIPQHYGAASEDKQDRLAVPGFFQPVEVPWRTTVGVGFVPNRFFRADLTVNVFFKDDNAALIRDEAARVGQHVTAQPHLGFAYVFADHKEFKATVYLGTYLEETRIAGTSNRVHGTGGAEARIWIITIGGGLDLASQYKSLLLSAGVDVFGLLARLHVIPPFGTPPSGKLLPKPWTFDDEGLARPLMDHWKPAGSLDPIKTALAIPKNLKVGAKTAVADLKEIGHELKETFETDAHRQKRLEAEREAAAAKLALEVEQAREQAELAETARLAVEKVRADAAAAAKKRRRLAKLRALRRKRSQPLVAPR